MPLRMALTTCASCSALTNSPALSNSNSQTGIFIELDSLNSPHKIQQPPSLEVTVSAEVGSRCEEQFLDLFGIADILAADGKKGRDGSGNVGSRHAGAAVFDVKVRRVCLRRQDAFAGSHQIGLHPPVAGRPF